MPQFHTKDGELVHFESRQDPIVPFARVVWSWLVARRFPLLLALANSVVIGSSTGGVLITLVATYALLMLGYRFAKHAVGEAAYWSRKMGAIDVYRTRAQRMQNVDPYN
jgi:hypothetical protein